MQVQVSLFLSSRCRDHIHLDGIFLVIYQTDKLAANLGPNALLRNQFIDDLEELHDSLSDSWSSILGSLERGQTDVKLPKYLSVHLRRFDY